MRLFYVVVAITLMALPYDASTAANIERRTIDSPQLNIITISGVIAAGDERRFKNLAATATTNGLVVLNSEGGSTLTAIEIGKAVRLAGFSTLVPSESLCASACALIWLSGTPRFSEDDSHIGFHASYIVKNGQPSESGVGNALVGAYLTQLGLPQKAIVFVTSAPPEGIEWLDQNKARSVGIEFTSLKTQMKESQQSPAKFGITEEKYDPIGTVTNFYNALAAADGNTAAAFVIPEKRGVGPFNESNIAKFFGNMREPLRLISVTQLTATSVGVEYRYVYANGKICNGRSEVTTEYDFGKTLIQGIRALNNC
jgi:hypothetical protein